MHLPIESPEERYFLFVQREQLFGASSTQVTALTANLVGISEGSECMYYYFLYVALTGSFIRLLSPQIVCKYRYNNC